MAIGSSGLYEYHPDFPEGRAPELWFNLFNNMWGTNFPQWIEGNFRYRFTIKAVDDEKPHGLEVVHVSVEDGKIYLLLRDHSEKSGEQILSFPGWKLCQTDFWHRPVGEMEEDSITLKIRPNGLHCVCLFK